MREKFLKVKSHGRKCLSSVRHEFQKKERIEFLCVDIYRGVRPHLFGFFPFNIGSVAAERSDECLHNDLCSIFMYL